MKKSLIIVMAAVMCLGVLLLQPGRPALAAPEFNLDAKSAILLDAETGTVVYAKNENNRQPVASVTKVMTLLMIFEAIEQNIISMDQMVQISQNAAGMGGSQALLDTGSSYTVKELLKSIIVASANDSCVALAEQISGTVEAFVAKMNERAQQLGLAGTKYVNCTGLPADDHYSTAADIAILSQRLIRYDAYYEFSKVWTYDMVHPKNNRLTTLTNTNRLIRFFEGADGLKTGYTSQAGHCLSATAKRNNTRLIAIVLGGSTSAKRFEEAQMLLNYGFANYKSQKILVKGEPVQETIFVREGKSSTVEALCGSDVSLFVANGDNKNIEIRFEPLAELTAPIEKGQKVGELIVLKEGEEVARVDAVAKYEVKKANFFDYLYAIISRWIS